jgi:hypothetical protein
VQALRAGGAAFLPPGIFFGSYRDGWDDLTEENADHCLGHLPTLIAAEDMHGLTRLIAPGRGSAVDARTHDRNRLLVDLGGVPVPDHLEVRLAVLIRHTAERRTMAQ